MNFAFGNTYRREEWELGEVYAWYDFPLLYQAKHIPTGHLYLGLSLESSRSYVSENPDIIHSIYVDALVLLTDELLESITTSQRTFREILLEGHNTERILLKNEGKQDKGSRVLDSSVTIKPLETELLLKKYLDESDCFNFTLDGL